MYCIALSALLKTQYGFVVLFAVLYKACLPIRDKRQRDFFVYFILTLNFRAITRQKPCNIKELYLYSTIFITSPPGIKKSWR